MNIIYLASDFSSFRPVPSLDIQIYYIRNHFPTGIFQGEYHAKTNFMYYKDVLNVSEW